MRYINIDKQELKKDTQVHYKTVEEFLLTEFPKGFQEGTQVALYREKENESRFILIKETFEEDLKLELKDTDNLVVIVNPKGGAVKQTLIGVAMIVVGSATFGIGSAFLVQAGVGVALGGVSQMLMDKPEIPQPVQMKDTPKADEVFSANFSQIKPKLGEMIPVGYGTFRKSPDMIWEYTRYENNNELHYMLLCLGYGQYNIQNAYLGDTNINDLKGTITHFPVETISDANYYALDKDSTDWQYALDGGGFITESYLDNPIKKIRCYIIINTTATTTVKFALGLGSKQFFAETHDVEYKEFSLDFDGTETYKFIICEMLNIEKYHVGQLCLYIKILEGDITTSIASGGYYISSPEKAIILADNVRKEYVNHPYNAYHYPIKVNEVSNIEILEDTSYIKLGEIINGKNLQQLQFNIVTSGIYNTADDGTLTDHLVDIQVKMYHEDTSGVKRFFTADLTLQTTDLFIDDTKNTPLNGTFTLLDVALYKSFSEHLDTETTTGQIIGVFSIGKNNYVIKHENDNLTEMDYAVFRNPGSIYGKVERVTPKSSSSRVSDKVFLKDIYAFMLCDSPYNKSNITYKMVQILVTNAISKSSSKNIIVEAERTDKQNDIKSVITDIFTNETYGGKLPQEMLNLPATTETFNHCFTANQTIKEAIEKVAISGMYMLKPNQGIGLHKIQSQPVQYFLDASRIKDLKVESVTKNEFMKDGYRVFYRDSEYKEQYVTYPADASYPNELHLAGCSSEQIASNYAYYLYQSEHKSNIRYRFSIELEGNTIPLYSRVKIGFNHIKTGFSSTVNIVIDYTSFYSTDYIMFEPVKDLDPVLETVTHTFQAGEASIIFHNDNLEASKTLEISEISRNPKFGWKITTIEPLPDYLKNGTPYHLGYTQKFIKDTVVKEKVWNGSGWDMMCEAYSEEVFQ